MEGWETLHRFPSTPAKDQVQSSGFKLYDFIPCHIVPSQHPTLQPQQTCLNVPTSPEHGPLCILGPNPSLVNVLRFSSSSCSVAELATLLPTSWHTHPPRIPKPELSPITVLPILYLFVCFPSLTWYFAKGVTTKSSVVLNSCSVIMALSLPHSRPTANGFEWMNECPQSLKIL